MLFYFLSSLEHNITYFEIVNVVLEPIDFNWMKKKLFFHGVSQKKESHTSLKQHEGE